MGILIGVDYYYKFILGNVIKTNGPCASSSILGWVLSGPVSNIKPELNFCSESHTLKCDAEENKETLIDLREELSRF